MLKNIWAKITGKSNGKDSSPTQDMTYFGKSGTAINVFPYGYFSNIANDDLASLICMGEGNSDKAIIGVRPTVRPELEQNEVSIYHPKTGSVIKFLNDGNIQIDTDTDIIGNCKNATITATDLVTIDGPLVRMTGDLTVDGTITAPNVNATASLIIDGKEQKGHTHTGSPTAPDGAVSDTGAQP